MNPKPKHKHLPDAPLPLRVCASSERPTHAWQSFSFADNVQATGRIDCELPLLQPTGLAEHWYGEASARHTQEDGFALVESDDLLFASISVDATDDAQLAAVSEAVYTRLYALLDAHGKPHALRIWNQLSDINAGLGDAERYRLFCEGRHAALADRLDAGSRWPAASAVGDSSGQLRLFCLAATNPGLPLENPRQVAAYRYPRQYGPRSPSFARATLQLWQPRAASLFVSGTASIVGHESRHPGDVAAQTRETLLNIDALLDAARARLPSAQPWDADVQLLRVYLRHAEHAPVVAELVRQRFGSSPCLYLHADICRAELDVEIEGTWGFHQHVA